MKSIYLCSKKNKGVSMQNIKIENNNPNQDKKLLLEIDEVIENEMLYYTEKVYDHFSHVRFLEKINVTKKAAAIYSQISAFTSNYHHFEDEKKNLIGWCFDIEDWASTYITISVSEKDEEVLIEIEECITEEDMMEASISCDGIMSEEPICYDVIYKIIGYAFMNHIKVKFNRLDSNGNNI